MELTHQPMPPSTASHETDRIMRRPEVLQVLGVSPTTLQRWIKEGIFPPPVKPGGTNSRTTGWLKSDVDDYFAGLREQAA